MALSLIDKVTTRTQSFVPLIENVPAPVEMAITQFTDKARMILISQLISDISGVVQKLCQYFNDTIISTSFILPTARVFSLNLTLDLNDFASVTGATYASAGSSF